MPVPEADSQQFFANLHGAGRVGEAIMTEYMTKSAEGKRSRIITFNGTPSVYDEDVEERECV